MCILCVSRSGAGRGVRALLQAGACSLNGASCGAAAAVEAGPRSLAAAAAAAPRAAARAFSSLPEPAEQEREYAVRHVAVAEGGGCQGLGSAAWHRRHTSGREPQVTLCAASAPSMRLIPPLNTSHPWPQLSPATLNEDLKAAQYAVRGACAAVWRDGEGKTGRGEVASGPSWACCGRVGAWPCLDRIPGLLAWMCTASSARPLLTPSEPFTVCRRAVHEGNGAAEGGARAHLHQR